ncbi:MAG: acetylglutamate kinase [Proteobacteria bacterium]|nr:acetylglutamate kinase [Pseudomonadota bacterium]
MMMNVAKERMTMISALKHAVPYIKLYKKKTFVIKAGGEVFTNKESTLRFMEQIGILHNLGIRTVVIHGGGPQSTALEKALGLSTKIVDGRRVTDADSLAVSIMVLNGQINTQILACCRDLGIHAVGISGVDCGLIKAHKRPLVKKGEESIDFGFVGDIDSVDVSVINKQLDSDLVPIISPLSSDEHGTLLNINADTVAAAIASQIGAEKLILATGAPGILEDVKDPTSLISYIDLEQLNQMKVKGKLMDGMLPKVAAIESAINAGVNRVHIISHELPDSILLEIFTNEGTGTLVVKDIESLTKEEQKA